MKKNLLLALAFALAAPACMAQTDSVVHVNQFPGTTIAAKLTAAMKTCPASPVPCILTVDASLAAAAQGTFPTLCANCLLYDWRDGVPTGNIVPDNLIHNTFIPAAQSWDQLQVNHTTLAGSSNYQENAVGAYIINHGTTPNPVALFADAYTFTNHHIWAANFAVADAAGLSGTIMTGLEVDVSNSNTSDVATAIAAGSAALNSSASNTAFLAFINAGSPFNQGYYAGTGCCNYGFLTGAASTANSSNSLVNGWQFVNSSGTTELSSMYVNNTGAFIFQPFGSGVFDVVGSIKAEIIASNGTTNVTGCSFTNAVGGQGAGQFKSGTAGTCTVTITPGVTASNGFHCTAADITTTADTVKQTGSTTTTATIAGTTASGDVITWGCIAY